MWNKWRLKSAVSFCLGMMAGIVSASPLKSDEQIVFFPTAAAYNSSTQTWQLPIHGWIFEPKWGGSVRQAWQQLFGKEIFINNDEDDAESSLLKQRLRWFFVDNERGKTIAIQLGAYHFTLPHSAANGHFSGEFTLPAAAEKTVSSLSFQVLTPPGDQRVFTGEAYLIPPSGLSVISDIDDTIKHSEVLDKSELLRNTFSRPFQAVSGMAALYQQWSAKGAAFHYVSASPWQLYPALAAFFAQENFPGGSFHLRLFRIHDDSFEAFLHSSRPHKLESIRALLARYPQRRFVLVGDSGEQDPEIYGDIARAYPQQIQAIFIRELRGDTDNAPRYQQSFQDLAPFLWQVFQQPEELPTVITLPTEIGK